MIKIGIIGAGNNAKGNAEKFSKFSDRCRIVAIADVVKENAEKLASLFNARVYEDYRDFLDSVDAVVISTPNFLHSEQAIECANAGKHIWIEKPMSLSLEDAEEVVKVVKEKNVASMIGFSVRFDEPQVTMKSLYENGELGELITVWSRRLTYADIQGWRADFKTSGGVINELLCHEIDWLVSIGGMPQTVYCQILGRKTDHPLANDHIWMLLRFAQGKVGSIEGSFMSPLSEYYRGISGRKASVFTINWGKDVVLQKANSKNIENVPLKERFDKYEHFLDVIDGKCKSVADVEWGLKIVKITQMALKSAVENRVISI